MVKNCGEKGVIDAKISGSGQSNVVASTLSTSETDSMEDKSPACKNISKEAKVKDIEGAHSHSVNQSSNVFESAEVDSKNIPPTRQKSHMFPENNKTEAPSQNTQDPSYGLNPTIQTNINHKIGIVAKKKDSLNLDSIISGSPIGNSHVSLQRDKTGTLQLDSTSAPQSPANRPCVEKNPADKPLALAKITFSTKSHTVSTDIGVMTSPMKSTLKGQFNLFDSNGIISHQLKHMEKSDPPPPPGITKTVPSLFVNSKSDIFAPSKSDELFPDNTVKNSKVQPIIEHNLETKVQSKVTEITPESRIERNKRLRSRLVDTYAPYIHPTDNSLADARKRLRTAVDQTRMLREAFSERVYNKYRVVLRPVERKVDEIIDPIRKNPALMKMEILKKIKIIKAEKEIEKKESHRLNSEFSASHNSGETNYLMSGVENAEQLSWFSAGLSLVILPEEVVNVAELKARGIQHRGPINPETGSRVGRISSAAATAANAMLDRVRKGAALRMERKAKYKSELYSLNPKSSVGPQVDQPVFTPIFPRKQNTTTVPISSGSSPVPFRTGTTTSMKHTKLTQQHSGKKAMVTKKGKNPNQKNTKMKKSKVLPYGVNLLSILPSGEGLLPNGKPSSTLCALISCGVGRYIPTKSNKSSNIQRLKHPFPQSKAAKAIAAATFSPSQYSKKSSEGLLSFKTFESNMPAEAKKLILHPASHTNKRRKLHPYSISYQKDILSEDFSSQQAIRQVIQQFISDTSKDNSHTNSLETENQPCKKVTNAFSVSTTTNISEKKTKTNNLKRKVTEMGLLRAFHSTTTVPSINGNDIHLGYSRNSTSIPNNSVQKVDPLFTISVLHALGLITDRKQDPSINQEGNHTKTSFIETFQNSGNKFTISQDDTINSGDEHDQSCSSFSSDSIKRSSLHVINRSLTDSIIDNYTSHEIFQNERKDSQLNDKKSEQMDSLDVKHRTSNSFDNSLPEGKTLKVDYQPNKGKEPRKEFSIEQVGGMESHYIPNLRGGGDSNMNLSDSSLSPSSNNKGEENRNPSLISNQTSIDSSQLDSTVSSFPLSVPRGGSLMNTSPNVHGLPGTSVIPSSGAVQRQHQIHNQFSNDLLQSSVLWGDQRNDLSSLHSQTGVTMLPAHITSSGLDSAYSLIAQSTPPNNSSAHHTFPQSSNSSTNGISMAVSAAARLQGQHQQHQSLSNPLNSTHDRFHQHTNASSSSHHLHLPSNSMQHATSLHHPSNRTNHTSSDVGDFFPSGIHLQQPPVVFGNSHHDWASLGAATGLLSTHSSLATMGLTSHQAAMVSLSVRERAARAILAARGQQQHQHQQQKHQQKQKQQAAAHSRVQVAAAHNSSVINRGSPSLSNMPAPQANIFLDSTNNTVTPASPFNNSSKNNFVNMNLKKSSPSPSLVSSTNAALLSIKLKHLPPTEGSKLQKQSSQKLIQNKTSANSEAKHGASKAHTIANQLENIPLKIRNKKSPPPQDCDNSSKDKMTKTDETKKNSTVRTISLARNNMIKPGNASKLQHEQVDKESKIENKPLCKILSDDKTKTVLSNGTAILNLDESNNLTLSENKLPEYKSTKEMNESIRISDNVISSQNNAIMNKNAEVANVPATNITSNELLLKLSKEYNGHVSINSTPGLQFYVPTPPQGVSLNQAVFILKAEFHKAVLESNDSSAKVKDHSLGERTTQSLLLEYLLSVSAAVPIPKAIILNPLKDRLNLLSSKSNLSAFGNTSFMFPREVMGASITTWLWAHHKLVFEKAFIKSGRIDVDPECKWLINSAIDIALKACRPEDMENPVESDFWNHQHVGKYSLSSNSSSKQNEHLFASSNINTVALNIACEVSRKLTNELFIDEDVDSMIPNLDSLISHLDNLRMCSLRARSQERVLLAALVSRHVRMSTSFANAYTSSMIRAGEALGYEDLCEIVQNEVAFASTLMPFDILSDSTGAWEDPCRPASGFVPGLTGDELTRKAHARALIQKSLKKIQDRYKIEGGATNAGPYTDAENPSIGDKDIASSQTLVSSPKTIPNLNRSSSGLKRKHSFAETGGLVQGTLSSAVSALFNPNHYSSPLIWDNDNVENMPYGRHECNVGKPRSVSIDVRLSLGGGGKRVCRSPTKSIQSIESCELGDHRSTFEIEWADVASMFQPVSSADKSSSHSRSNSHGHSTPVPLGSKIFAPYCRLIDIDNLPGQTDSDESDSEEDISDEKVLERHQEVLDGMKEKLDALMEVRQHYQERSRR